MLGVSRAGDATGIFAVVVVLMAGAGFNSAGAGFEAGGFGCVFSADGCGVSDLAPAVSARLDAEDVDSALGLTADMTESVAVAFFLAGVGCSASTLAAVFGDWGIDGAGCTFEGGTAAPDKEATAAAGGANTDLVIVPAPVGALRGSVFVVPVVREVFGVALDVSAGWAGAAAGRAARRRAMLASESVDDASSPSAGLPSLPSGRDTLGTALSGM
jgi:hypothetical protein